MENKVVNVDFKNKEVVEEKGILDDIDISSTPEPELTKDSEKYSKLQERFDLSDSDMLQFMNFIVGLREKGFDASKVKFSDLPSTMQGKINKVIMDAGKINGLGNVKADQLQSFRNLAVQDLVEELNETMFADKAWEEYDEEFKMIQEEIANEPDMFEKYMKTTTDNFKDNLIKNAEKYKDTDPEKYNRIVELSGIYMESFSLQYMLKAFAEDNKIRREVKRTAHDEKAMRKMLNKFNFMFQMEGTKGNKNVVNIHKALTINNTISISNLELNVFMALLYNTVKNYDMRVITDFSLVIFTLQHVEGVAYSDMTKSTNVNLQNFMANMKTVINFCTTEIYGTKDRNIPETNTQNIPIE